MKNRKIPTVLTVNEVDTLLKQPDVSTIPGIRDRAILEIIYGCGLRVSELCNLAISSINKIEQICRILGKGNKERIIPITLTALKWYERYIIECRVNLPGKNSPLVFPNRKGKAFTRQAISDLVHKYNEKAGIDKNVHPHTLRHSIATHLHENGADLMTIRDLLGHEDISTTQIYTHITITHLKNIYTVNHPRR